MIANAVTPAKAGAQPKRHIVSSTLGSRPRLPWGQSFRGNDGLWCERL
jgi:hypothetical protein